MQLYQSFSFDISNTWAFKINLEVEWEKREYNQSKFHLNGSKHKENERKIPKKSRRSFFLREKSKSKIWNNYLSV